MEITRNGDERQWKLAKSKESSDRGACYRFKLETVEIGMTKQLPKGKNQRLIYEVARDYLVQQKLDIAAGDCEAVAGIQFDEGLTLLSDVLDHLQPKHSRMRAKEAIAWLIDNDFLALHDRRIVLPDS